MTKGISWTSDLNWSLKRWHSSQKTFIIKEKYKFAPYSLKKTLIGTQNKVNISIDIPKSCIEFENLEGMGLK